MGGYIGGFAGATSGSLIGGSYARGNILVQGDVEAGVGGFVGTNGALVIESYSTGYIDFLGAGDYVGGFIGQNEDETASSFYDLEASEQENGCGVQSVSCDEVFGKTTTQMKTRATFTEIDSESEFDVWDFEDVWMIDPDLNDGYPVLRYFHDEDEESAPVYSNQPRIISSGSYSVSRNKTINPFVLNDNPIKPIEVIIRNLKIGMIGEDVRSLQKLLNKNGFFVSSNGAGSFGQETNYFGPKTQKALSNYQKQNKISPTAGYFGPITRSQMKSKKLTGVWW